MTFSALGDRQIFPQQTNKIERISDSIEDIGWMESGSGAPIRLSGNFEGLSVFYRLPRASSSISVTGIVIDLVKKTVLAGVGAAALTKEKAEEALGELVDKGKLSANEAKETAEKIAEDGKREFESATSQLQEKFDELLSKAGFNQSERIDELETKISDLEARLKALEDSGSE
tara:strand:+ start:150 stop:668 length:519 start_codon:yes stop_codon:yes gene_type:complete